jgi:hypothetical protein
MIDVPLFQAVLDHVTDNPGELDQGYYWRPADNACGTAGCIAGHTVVMTGHEIRFGHWISSAFYCVDGRLISDVAQVELGLSDDQAGRLFEAENSLPQLWDLASEFTNGAIKVPASVMA